MTLTTSELIKLLLRKSLRMRLSILIKLELVNTVPDQRWASQHTPTPSKLTKYNNLVSTEHSVAVARKRRPTLREPVEVQVVHRKIRRAQKLLFSLWLYTRRIEAVAVRLNKLVWIGCKIQYAGRSSSRRGM